MKPRSVRLMYRYAALPQHGAEVGNPLFELLDALRVQGSIQRAAAALGLSYRHVWGSLKAWEAELGEPLVVWKKGQPARLAPFAERLLWAEARARHRLVPHIEALRHELEQVMREARDGSQPLLAAWASHDLALPRLVVLAREEQSLHLELKFAGSLDALRALAEGRCAVAGFHVPALPGGAHRFSRAIKPLLEPGRHKLIGFARRSQVLMLAPGNPLGVATLAELGAARRLRFVQRQPGSGTRLLVDHLLEAAGAAAALDRHTVLVEDSHLAVAAAVASGAADAGVGLHAAAASFGLTALPLVDEDYFLVCLADRLETPAVQALRRTLASRGWPAALAGLPGYAASRAGQVLSLTRALPWWQFRTPRLHSAPQGGAR